MSDEYVIRRAEDKGWYVWDDACGLVLAAFSDGDALCDWLRKRIVKPKATTGHEAQGPFQFDPAPGAERVPPGSDGERVLSVGKRTNG